MNVLLDTCTFLWLCFEPHRLSSPAMAAFEGASQRWLSAVSAWEIAVKYRLGKLALPEDPSRFVPDGRRELALRSLAFGEDEALQEHRLPSIHRDPFDRMLVAQAIVHGLALLTPDPEIGRYPVVRRW